MDQPQNEPPVNLHTLDAISTLDTARIALRWALERVRSLENERAETGGKLERSEKLLVEAQQNNRALESALSKRTVDDHHRQVYHRKLEELLAARLAGQLDLKRLLEREVELAMLGEVLQARQLSFEKDFQARREELELDYQRRAQAAAEKASEDESRLEGILAERRAAMDKEHVGSVVAARELQLRLEQQERALAERQARFEEFNASQRARLDADLKSLREEAAQQAAMRQRDVERLFEERHASLAERWAQEKSLYEAEVADLRKAIAEATPRVLELERELAKTQTEARHARLGMDRELADKDHALAEERASLGRQLETARQRLCELEVRLNDSETMRLATEESKRQLERHHSRVQELLARFKDIPPQP